MRRARGGEWTRCGALAVACAALAYDFGGRLRLEVEYFHRDSKVDQSAPVASATGATFAKLGGEIQVAEERIKSVTADSVFADLYVDFATSS